MRQKRNNKGFSLVELIVVIAIMIVLVAVLAPVFTKYVEQSRRATDVQNANSIAEAILTDATDGTIKGDVSVAQLTDTNKPSAIKSVPEVKGNAYATPKFFIEYNASTNEAHVFVGNDSAKSGDLTKEKAAQDYKDAKKAGAATDDQDNGGN